MIPVANYNIAILVKPEYLALLSSDFTHDYGVVKKGLYVGVQVVERGGRVVYFKESRGSGFAYTAPFYVDIPATSIPPYTVFMVLSWYYPRYGLFVRKFRITSKPSPRNQRVVLKIDPSSGGYLTEMQTSLRNLRLKVKRLGSSNNASSVRPSPEVRVTKFPLWIYQSWGGPDPHPWGSGTRLVETFRRTWSGTRTPGYWSKRRSSLPVNGHSSDTLTVHANTLLRHKEWPDTGRVEEYVVTVDSYYYTTTGHYPLGDRADNLALSRLISRMGAETANLAQDIGEIGETLWMIDKTISRLHNALNYLKVGNTYGAVAALYTGRGANHPSTQDFKWAKSVGSGAKALAKATAENWLELQYGWKPLLSDIRDALDKNAKFFSGPGPFVVMSSKASASDRYKGNGTNLASSYATGSGTVWAGKTDLTTRKTVKYGVRWKVADAHKAFLAQTGFLNPIDLAWELLPFSFVADWFLPIGPWLNSFTAFQGLEFLDGYKIIFQRSARVTDIDCQWKVGPPTFSNESGFEKGLWHADRVSLVRTKLDSFPAPHLPVIKSPWSVGHILNGLALLTVGFETGSRLHV